MASHVPLPQLRCVRGLPPLLQSRQNVGCSHALILKHKMASHAPQLRSVRGVSPPGTAEVHLTAATILPLSSSHRTPDLSCCSYLTSLTLLLTVTGPTSGAVSSISWERGFDHRDSSGFDTQRPYLRP